jgi:hypothetical protein
MQMVTGALEILRRLGQRLGPYLVLEILLPGGTLLALLLFLYQRRKLHSGALGPGWGLVIAKRAGNRATP